MADDLSKENGADAYDLFPDLLGEAAEPKEKNPAPVVEKPTVSPEVEKIVPKKIPPPEPPDLNWLKSGELRSKSRNLDAPTALLLVSDDAVKTTAGEAFANAGYQVEDAVSEEQAIIKMNSGRFTAVLLHEDFVGSDLKKSGFHKFMKSMSMVSRRPIFYTLIGSDFHTLYDLEALCESANVVVNTADAKLLNIIVPKGLKDYEKLFGSFIKANRR